MSTCVRGPSLFSRNPCIFTKPGQSCPWPLERCAIFALHFIASSRYADKMPAENKSSTGFEPLSCGCPYRSWQLTKELSSSGGPNIHQGRLNSLLLQPRG